jgi:hypothetical protein
MASTSTPKREGEFAIYLLAQDLSMYQLAESDLSTLEREDEPILTLDDIVSYRWETHEIVLIPYAGGRFSRLKVPLDGLPFVVCVGDEAIYSGAFWSMYSSAIYDGISIWVPLLEGPVLPIKLGYPDVNYFGGEDTRSDPRILESLERAGVLE